jgi:hypothetical protein
LNDLGQLYNYRIDYDGGLEYCDLWKLMQAMNRMPQRNLGWKLSIDVARALVSQK